MNAHSLVRLRAIAIAAAFCTLALAGCATSSSSTFAAGSLDAAIAGPQRSEQAKKCDVYRHPKETLQFFDLAPTQTVLEIAPGGGWYTDILAPYLHYAGQLYEAQYVSTSYQLAAEDSETDANYRKS